MQKLEALSQSPLLNPVLKIVIQLIRTTSAHPARPAKNRISIAYIAQSIPSFIFLPVTTLSKLLSGGAAPEEINNQFPKAGKVYAQSLASDSSSWGV